uniref:Peptidase M16 N-terminal domain-containing protein n=1 Tax=viral metagenome TaxID=1070528 RepID=A0A6C0J3N9_9ZZZZ
MKIPKTETRKFYSNELDNKIKYTIIQDTNIQNAVVCVCIKAGSIDNPNNYQGLAHFLEHMLFLGSKKYPKENYFDETLRCHGGSSNAYTALYETVYYFSVNNNYFEKILEIFSRFFIDPLFNSSSVSREINAINSEHMKNINNDMWRLNHFIKTLAKKNTIINKFSTGSLETLNKKNIRNEMINFYNNYYCSNNMTVAIISPNSINKTNKIFTNIFNNIPNKIIKKNNIIKQDDFYNNQNMEYQIIPMFDTTEINYIWEIDLPFKYLKNSIFDIIAYTIIGDEEENLERFLFKKGLIKSLSATTLEEGLFLLMINVNKSYNTDIKITFNEINSYVKYYFDNLDKLNWKKLYDYYDKKSKLLFNYTKISDENDLVDVICNNMQYYDKNHYYCGASLIIDKNYSFLEKNLKLLKFDKCFKIYSCSDNLSNHKFKIENYYKFKYKNLKSSQQLSSSFKFNIPTKNDFINIKPKNIKDLDKFEKPKNISTNIYYGGSSKFNTPSVISTIVLRNKTFFDTIENYFSTTIGVRFINYKLSKQFFKEFELGYNINLITNILYTDININITGFNDKYVLFFNNILKYFKELSKQLQSNNDNDYILDLEINNIIENFKNVSKLSPWDYSDILVNQKIIPNDYDYEKKLVFLTKFDKIKLLKLIKQRVIDIFNFENIPKIVLFYGNIKKDTLPKIVNKNIKLPKLNNSKKIQNISVKHPNKNENNNLLMVTFYSGKYNIRNNTLLLIITILMDQPCYDYLRTKQQLGYLVKSGIKLSYPNYYLYIKLQSIKDINILEKNVNVFLNTFKNTILKDLSNNFKTTVKELLEIEETKISELHSLYLNKIKLNTMNIDRKKLMIKELKLITTNDVIKYFNKIIKNKKNIKIYI